MCNREFLQRAKHPEASLAREVEGEGLGVASSSIVTRCVDFVSAPLYPEIT
jgi:hypothetical protein